MANPEAKESLKQEVILFLNGVTIDNFSKSYDGMIEVILPYRKKLPKSEVGEIFIEVMNSGITDYQDEILVEISNRLNGNCRTALIIEWE